jgi:hypothetical protein
MNVLRQREVLGNEYTRGGNIPGVGIQVHTDVIDQYFDISVWGDTSLRDRIDAVVVHEYIECNARGSLEERHATALQEAPNTQMLISDDTRGLLRAQLAAAQRNP